MESVWYYVSNGAQIGPVSFAELKSAAAAGKFTPNDLVWEEGRPDWVPASTVSGLFGAPKPPQPTYSLSPPPPPPPAYPLEPEPLPLDDEPPTQSRKRSRPAAPVADGAPTNAGLPEWVNLISVFLRRATTADPGKVRPELSEDGALDAAGITDAASRKLAAWRRAMLFVAAVPCAFAALFGLIDVIAMEKEQKEFYSAFGLMLFYVRAFAVFALPVAAVFAALAYDRLAVSAKWVLIGGLVSFAVPIAVAFAPTEWLVESKGNDDQKVAAAARDRLMNGLLVGVQFYVLLVPAVMSLLPAVSRACVRLKLLLPEALVPGWGLVTSAPLFVLLTLSLFVLLYHTIGNALLLIGLVLWIGSPLLYLTKFPLLTKPITEPAERDALSKLSYVVLGTMTAGILMILVFMLTTKIGKKTILGFDSETSAVRPWSLDLHKLWIEYLGRSLFLTVFFADLVLRMSLSVWKEERAFAGSTQSTAFDRTMGGLASAVGSK